MWLFQATALVLALHVLLATVGSARTSDNFGEFCGSNESGGDCPCNNPGFMGEGCRNSDGVGAYLFATGEADIENDTLVLHIAGSPAFSPGIFFSSYHSSGSAPFGNGLLCLSGEVTRLQVVAAGSNGAAHTSVLISQVEEVTAGERRVYQYWYRDIIGPCGAAYNTSNGLAIRW